MFHKRKGIDEREKDIEDAIITCFNEHNGNYGRPRIKKALENDYGIKISESKVARIMKENGLVAKAGRRKKRRKPKPTQEQLIQENLLLDMDLSQVGKNEVLVSDITELPIKTSILHLTGILEVSSRILLGYYISTHQRQEIVHMALHMALNKIDNTKGIIFHSDRGSQYTSNATQKILTDNEMEISMSRPGEPNDNQMIESFWKSLKMEIGSELKTMNIKEAKETIVDYLHYYNNERLHSALDHQSPIEHYESMKPFNEVVGNPEAS